MLGYADVFPGATGIVTETVTARQASARMSIFSRRAATFSIGDARRRPGRVTPRCRRDAGQTVGSAGGHECSARRGRADGSFEVSELPDDTCCRCVDHLDGLRARRRSPAGRPTRDVDAASRSVVAGRVEFVEKRRPRPWSRPREQGWLSVGARNVTPGTTITVIPCPDGTFVRGSGPAARATRTAAPGCRLRALWTASTRSTFPMRATDPPTR